MDADCVLVKTPAGVEEIAARTRRIGPRLRTVLILVDGRRSVGHLRDTAGGLADVGQALAELKALGLIAAVEPPAHSVARSEPANRASQALSAAVAPAAAAPAVAGRRRSLALARLYLLNAMEKSLRKGGADHVRELLRQATTRPQLLSAFALCVGIAAEAGGTHLSAIENEFMLLLPEEELAPQQSGAPLDS